MFLSAVLRQPAVTGAIAPSSRSLAKVLCSVVPRFDQPTVVELGAGTGAISDSIARRLASGGTHLAVELDARLAHHLRATRPELRVLEGDAGRLGGLLRSVGVGKVDAVVSGLPWSLFDEERQHRILREVRDALRPRGGFSTLAYRHAAALPGARRFRALLHEYFDEVTVTHTVWGNLPPAFVYVCHGLAPHREAGAEHDRVRAASRW